MCPTYESYRHVVTKQLKLWRAPGWEVSAQHHRAQVPYCTFQAGPSDALVASADLLLDWKHQPMVRGWCRFRAGLVCVRHLGMRRSKAKYQNCIFCQGDVPNATKHVLAGCPFWRSLRAPLLSEWVAVAYEDLALRILRTGPKDNFFLVVLELLDAIDSGATGFWVNRQ